MIKDALERLHRICQLNNNDDDDDSETGVCDSMSPMPLTDVGILEIG
jgi:hypothetical protein